MKKKQYSGGTTKYSVSSESRMVGLPSIHLAHKFCSLNENVLSSIQWEVLSTSLLRICQCSSRQESLLCIFFYRRRRGSFLCACSSRRESLLCICSSRREWFIVVRLFFSTRIIVVHLFLSTRIVDLFFSMWNVVVHQTRKNADKLFCKKYLLKMSFQYLSSNVFSISILTLYSISILTQISIWNYLLDFIRDVLCTKKFFFVETCASK